MDSHPENRWAVFYYVEYFLLFTLVSRSGFEKWTSAHRQISLFQTHLTGALKGKKVRRSVNVTVYSDLHKGYCRNLNLTPTRAGEQRKEMSLRQIRCRGVQQNMHEPKNRWEITARIWTGAFLLSSIWKMLLMFPFMAGAENDKWSVRLYLACGQRKWEIEKHTHTYRKGGEWVCVKKEKKVECWETMSSAAGLNWHHTCCTELSHMSSRMWPRHKTAAKKGGNGDRC